MDTQSLPDLKMPLASTDKIKNFGKGQTETNLKLSLGNYASLLVLGNYVYIPQDKFLMTERIIIEVN